MINSPKLENTANTLLSPPNLRDLLLVNIRKTEDDTDNCILGETHESYYARDLSFRKVSIEPLRKYYKWLKYIKNMPPQVSYLNRSDSEKFATEFFKTGSYFYQLFSILSVISSLKELEDTAVEAQLLLNKLNDILCHNSVLKLVGKSYDNSPEAQILCMNIFVNLYPSIYDFLDAQEDKLNLKF